MAKKKVIDAKNEEIKVKGKNVGDISDEDIKNVVIGVNRYNFRDIVIGKKFDEEIKYCSLIEYKEIKVPKVDDSGNQLFDNKGNPLESVEAKVFFLPFGFPISYECNSVVPKDDIIPMIYTGNNNTPEFKRAIEDIKKRYIYSIEHLGK